MNARANVTAVRFSLRRLGLIAAHTLREAVRYRLLNFFVLIALTLVVGARWLGDFNFGAPELKFVADCGNGAIAFFGATLVIVAMAQLFLGEIENGTALTLLAKPVGRAEFVWGKFIGVVALAGFFCALLTAVLAAVLWTREGQLMAEFPDAFTQGRQVYYANLAVAALLQWARLSVLAALTLLVAAFARTQVFTIVTGFFVFVICHLQSLAHASYAQSAGAAGWYVTGFIGFAFPNFELFSVGDALSAAERVPGALVARLVAYAFVYIAVAGTLAVATFRRREL